MARLPVGAIARHLDRASRATTRYEKGRAYEAVVRELFESLPGVEVAAKNIRTPFKSEELDAGLWVGGRWCGLPLEEMVVPVEVKGWTGPVGSSEVSWFAAKLRVRSMKEGLLIAAHGIAGDPGTLTAARDVIQSALHDGIRILVITEAEIRALRTTDDLVGLLKQKQVNLRLTRSSI